MLDAVIDYLPSPVDVPAINGILDDGKDTPAERHASDDEPFCTGVQNRYRPVCW